jgi:hypothetical protein
MRVRIGRQLDAFAERNELRETSALSVAVLAFGADLPAESFLDALPRMQPYCIPFV